MATTSKESTNQTRTPNDIICDYLKTLKERKRDAEVKAETAKTRMQRANILRGYKLCCLELAETTHAYYQDMDNYELLDMAESAKLILEDVTTFAADIEALQNTIQSSSQKLIDVKTKLHDAHDAACAMYNCIDRNVELDKPKYEKIKDALDNVMEKARVLDSCSQDASDAMVKIAGIQTFIDGEGPTEMATDLKDQFAALRSDVEGYISAAAEDAVTAQTGVSEAVVTLNKDEFDRYEHTTDAGGLKKTKEFLCEEDCEHISIVDEICCSIGMVKDNSRPKEPLFVKEDKR